MKKTFSLLAVLTLLPLVGCGKNNDKVISVAASEVPHAEILNNVVKPILEKEGYTLEVTVLYWTIQNSEVESGTYDANYFQHRPYLEQYDSGNSVYDTNYTYTKVFPVATVHFEPLRIYAGKKSAEDFETNKKTAEYEICSDVSNEIRALELLKKCGAIDDYETDSDGNPINLPSNIHLIDENLLVSSLQDYDYAVLPANSALTGKLKADETLPVESDEVKDRNANVIAANVKKYQTDVTYKKKIDVLVDAVLSNEVATFIQSNYQGVVVVAQEDLRK